MQVGAAVKSGAVASQLYTGVALGQGLREDMEDYATVLEGDISKGEFTYAGVFDGHAGGKAAEYLTQYLGKELQKTVPKSDNLEKTLVDTFVAFDEKLMDFLQSKGGEQWNCGSTGTIALVWEDRLCVANVGDSRAVLSRKGRAMDVSSEHRPYGKDPIGQREMKRIKDAGGWISDGRVLGILAVSRAFADMEFKRGLEKLLVDGVVEGMWTKKFAKAVKFKEAPVVVTPDVLEIPLEEQDDFLIVASDGLWEVTTSAQAVTFVKRHLDKVGMSAEGLQSAAQALVDDAINRRRTSDNVSVVLVSLPAASSSASPTKAASATKTSASAPKKKPAASGGFFSNLFGRK